MYADLYRYKFTDIPPYQTTRMMENATNIQYFTGIGK